MTAGQRVAAPPATLRISIVPETPPGILAEDLLTPCPARPTKKTEQASCERRGLS